MDNSLFLKQLQDIGCTVAIKNNSRRSEADMSISVTDKSITVTLRNGVYKYFPSGHIGFTRFPNGSALFLYDFEQGGYSYQRSHNVACDNRYICTGIQSKLAPILKGWQGDFYLQFDEKTGWFYVTHEE